jgi:nitrite reductase/ring-hydroxylating ferredoxin subunit
MVKETVDEIACAAPDEIIGERWYPVARSASLRAGAPLGLERLGVKLVLWRGRAGQVIAHGAACPHRGAELSHGRVVGGQLECPYHGFRFDEAGACVLMPCEGPDARIRKDMRVSGWPTREASGLIWLWWGDGPPAEALPWLDGVDPEGAYTLSRELCWEVSLSRLVEGMTDVHHVPFAHRRYVRGVGTMLDPLEVRLEGEVIRASGVLRAPDEAPERGWPFEVAVMLPGVVRLGFGGVEILILLTPVSQTRTWGVVLYEQHHVRVPVLGQLWGRFLLWTEFAFIQPDDERLLVATQPPHSTPRVNRYVRADGVIALWHKLRAEALSP